jgi:hypothetical protein
VRWIFADLGRSYFSARAVVDREASEVSDSGEVIVGSIRVSASLRTGAEILTLFFTQNRLILAHIGKRGLTELPGMSLLGKWGAGIEGLLRGPGEIRRKKRVEKGAARMAPSDILKADKDNFDIVYGDIVRVELDDNLGLIGIMVLTKDDKYEFLTSQSFVTVSRLLHDTLGDKVEPRRA